MSQGPVPPNGPFPQAWRGAAAATGAGTPPASGRAKKLVGLLALLLALVGAVAALVLFPRGMTAPDFSNLGIRDYQTSLLPINSRAIDDGALLQKCFILGKVEKPHFIKGQALQSLNLDRKSRQPVVIYLCALPRWVDGKVYLLGAEADPDRPDTWVPLAEALQALRVAEASRKLLILDVMRPSADARFDIFAEEAAAQTHAALAKESNLPFFVLCASSPGQLSQVSEELGRSVFAHYLEKGLRGDADGCGARGIEDGRITVTELADFVAARVDRWAWQNRGLRQTPVLLGKGEDFPLVRFADLPDATAPPTPAAPPGSFPKWLAEAWAERDAWQPEESRLGPLILRDLDTHLLRAERRWRGGVTENHLATELQGDLQRLKAQKERIADVRRLQAPRWLAPLADQKTDPAWAPTLRVLLQDVVEPPRKLDEKELAKWKEDLKARTDQLLTAFKKAPAPAAQVLLEAAATTSNLAPAQFALLHQLLSPVVREHAYVETIFLERLKAAADVQDDFPLAVAQQALRTVRAAEESLAEIAREPAALPRVRPLLEEADKLRRGGEKELFGGQPDKWDDVDQALKNAQKLYKECRTRVNRVRTARQAWDRALRQLPQVGAVLAAQGKEDRGEEQAWSKAVESCLNLVKLLERRGLAPDAEAGLERHALELAQHLDDLQRSLEGKIKRCLELEGAIKDNDDLARASMIEAYLDIQALLESPWLEGVRRERLWRSGQTSALRLHEAAQAREKAEARSPAALGEDHAADREAHKQKWRARVAGDMNLLAGLAENDKPARLLEEFKAGEGNLAAADRLSRALHPFDLPRDRAGEPGHWSHNPALALHRKELAVFRQWQGARLQAEAQAAASEEKRFAEFYAAAAKEFSQAAASLK